jgi:hypothetical protein
MAQFNNAQEAMGFVADQTRAINATVYAAEYPDVDFASLVPVDSSAPEWASGMITYMTDTVGKADWISGMAKDIPLADVVRGQSSVDYEMAALGYDFSLEEVNVAALLGMPLTSMKADAARRGSNELLYDLALFGSARKGMAGLLNSAAVTSGLVAQNAGATSRLWSDKTPTEILADVDGILTGAYLATTTVELADTLLVSPLRLQYLNSRTMSDTNSETLLSFIMRTNFYKLTTGRDLTIRAVRGLATAGAGGTERMVAYSRNPRTAIFHLPMPHRFLPTWQNGPMNFLIPGIMRTGGTEIRRPSAVRYADGF